MLSIILDLAEELDYVQLSWTWQTTFTCIIPSLFCRGICLLHRLWCPRYDFGFHVIQFLRVFLLQLWLENHAIFCLLMCSLWLRLLKCLCLSLNFRAFLIQGLGLLVWTVFDASQCNWILRTHPFHRGTHGFELCLVS